jgi:hypothetical protein
VAVVLFLVYFLRYYVNVVKLWAGLWRQLLQLPIHKTTTVSSSSKAGQLEQMTLLVHNKVRVKMRTKTYFTTLLEICLDRVPKEGVSRLCMNPKLVATVL